MDNKEATRTCGQCHKEVAETNFALHETHCSRFLSLCPDCDEAVPREQLNEHRAEQHTQVRCSKCNQKVERRYLMDHEADECVERLQTCQFCDLQLPWKKLDEHCLACGSRTRLCRDCNRYVKLREQPEHGLTCSATTDDSRPPQSTNAPPNKTAQIRVSCSRCMVSFPAEDIDEHELECVPASEWVYYKSEPEEEKEEYQGNFFQQVTNGQLSNAYKATSSSDQAHSRALADRADPYKISTCPHCHLALPLVTLHWHEAKCQIHILLK